MISCEFRLIISFKQNKWIEFDSIACTLDSLDISDKLRSRPGLRNMEVVIIHYTNQ